MSSQTTHDVVEFLVAHMSLFLALLLTASALHKGFQFERVRNAAAALVGLSGHWASAAVTLVTSLESLAALLICVPGARPLGAWMAVGIFAMYLAVILRAIVKDSREVDCGCSFGSAHRRLGAFEVCRNSIVLMTAIAVSIHSSASEASLSFPDLLPAFVFLALYFAVDEVMAVGTTARKFHS